MPNRPFRFLDSPDLLNKLHVRLAQLKLLPQVDPREMSEESDSDLGPYKPGLLLFKCPWLSDPIELHWHYEWWPDGMNSELEKVSIILGGEVQGEVHIGDLKKGQLKDILGNAIIDALVQRCSEATRKSKKA
jgi:hypothetical protein